MLKNTKGSDDNPTAAPNSQEVIEYFDTKEELEAKVDLFVKLLKESTHCVFYTGAGISTSAHIPGINPANQISL